MHPIDHRRRIEQVGLASSGAAATHITRRCRAAVDSQHRGARTPTAAASLVVAEQQARHVGDVAEGPAVETHGLGGGEAGFVDGRFDRAMADGAPDTDADDVQRAGDQQRRAQRRLVGG